MALQQDPAPETAKRWDERRLFFWTVRESAKAVLIVAITAHTVVSLVMGRATLPESLLDSLLRAF